MHHSLLNKTLLALTLAGSLAASAQAQTQTPLGSLTGSGAVAYESQYVFRGKKIADSSIQPRGEIGLMPGGSPNTNIYLGAWSNQPVSRRTGGAGPDQSDEIDVYGGLFYNLPSASNSSKFSIDVGDMYYWYPEAGGASLPTKFGSHVSRSDEAYAGLVWSQVAPWINTADNPLKISAYYYHDFILSSDTAELAAETTFNLAGLVGINNFTLKPRVVGGWTSATKAWGDQLPAGIANWHNGYKYWGASIELAYKLSEGSFLFGDLSYAGNDDGKTGAPALIGGNPQLGGTPNSVWFGAGLRFNN